MEIYWESVTYAYVIIDILGMGFMLYRFARPFMEVKRRIFCVGAAYSATMLVLYFAPVSINNFLAYSSGILVAFLVMCKIDRRNYFQKIFIAVTFFSLRFLSRQMGLVIYGMISQWVISRAYMIERLDFQLGAYIVVDILDTVMRFLILEISIRQIMRAYVYKRENMGIKEMCILLVPSIVSWSEYAIGQYSQAFLETELKGTAFAVYNVLVFLHCGILIISIVVVIVLFQNIRVQQEEKQQNALMDTQMDSIRQHIGRIEMLYQDMRSMKHDMTNHILTLERLYEGDKREEAKAYREEIQIAFEEAMGEIRSGNPVTDVILQEIKREAKRKGIRFQTDFYYPEASNINAFDVSIILHNGLQNGLEHAPGCSEPWLVLSSYRKNNAYMIEIRNSFVGALQWDEERGLPRTSKNNPEGHGFGLANIRRVARKYSGDMDILLENEEFCLSVMLMLE